MGQPDAAASAYSIYDYTVAADLGGEAALADLQKRALQTRHTPLGGYGAESHGHRFAVGHRTPGPVHLARRAAVPASTRTRTRTCPRIHAAEIYLEDHYYDQTADGGGVQARRDPSTGEVRYVYHGNDGTSFAWNDTAQLDFSRADVREAVTQTILHVARQVPDHPLRCGDDAGQGTHPAAVVPSAGTDRTASPRGPGTG